MTAMAALPISTPIPAPIVTAVAGLGAPASLADGANGWRATALRRFAACGLPTRRLEAWKYTDLSSLQGIDFQPAAADLRLADDHPLPQLADQPGHRLVFADGVLQPALSAFTPAAGLDVGSLADWLSAADAAAGLGAAGEPSPMVALNAALASDGLRLSTAPGIAVDRPVELVFIGGLGEAATASHPRHRIELAAGSSATLIEVHAGGGDGCYLANHVGEITIGEHARLRHVIVQTEGATAYHIASRFVSVAADGRYEAFTLTASGRLTRNEVTVSLDGPGAACVLAGAYLLRDREHCDTTTIIEHRAPHTSCREVFKGVLDGASRGVFQGRIVVHRGAQKIDGHQLSKALLLSDAAEVDQKPELEIYADDVKCSHGAAAGQLDADELFYLRSRGIPEEQARRLLIEGFLVDVFDEVTDDAVRAALFAHARRWFAAPGGPQR